MLEQDLLAKYLAVLSAINNRLISIIENEIKKRQFIIINDIDALDQMNQQEERQLLELKNSEAMRMNLLQSLSEAWRVPKGQLTADSLQNYISWSDQDSLKFYQTMIELIKENMQRLQNLNQENQALTLMALDYIDEVQHLVLGEDNPGLYTDEEDGALEEHMRKTIKLIDKKV